MKLNIEKDGNDSLSIEHGDKIQAIFRKSIDLLISRNINNNNNNNNDMELESSRLPIMLFLRCLV